MDTHISFGLSAEQKAWQERVRDFVDRRVRPEAHVRERIQDPHERHPWDWVEELSGWGLRTATVPKALGGLGFGVLDCCVIGEELGAGDLGLAVIFDQTWKLTPWLTDMTSEAQRAQFLPEFLRDHRYLLALGLSEPDSGSDNFLPYGRLGDGVKTTAVTTVRDGRQGWLLNGVKAPISNGGSAGMYVIMARAGAEGAETTWLTPFLVPRDTPGFTVEFIYDKSGQRLAHNGHLVLRDCWVPEENRAASHPGSARSARPPPRRAARRRRQRVSVRPTLCVSADAVAFAIARSGNPRPQAAGILPRREARHDEDPSSAQ